MAIRRLIMTFLMAGILAVPGRALLADQDDPRLEGLFARLQDEQSAAAGASLEQRIWEIWLETDDSHARRLMRQGVAAMNGHAFGRALDRFDQLIEGSPDFAEAWNRRATLYYLMGDYPASVHDIERTLALEPRHFGALSGLGMIYERLDLPEAALRSFQAALDLNPHLEGARQRIEELRRELAGRRA